MILQALTRYYEDLLAEGKISRPGWVTAKVSYGLVLDEEGRLLQVVPLLTEVEKKNKKALVSREMEVPAPVKRTAGVQLPLRQQQLPPGGGQQGEAGADGRLFCRREGTASETAGGGGLSRRPGGEGVF